MDKSIFWVVALIFAIGALSGCAGMGVKLETYRIDEMQGSQKTHNKPLRCLFVSCNEEVQGS